MKFNKTVLLTTMIAGTLDIVAAFIQSYAINNIMPGTLLRYISSGIFGTFAYSSGIIMIIVGLLIHYFITFCCVFFFFLLYPKWNFFKKSVFFNSIFIGIISWIITTQIIIPLSKIHQVSFDINNVFKAIITLIFCIGLPVAYSAHRFYRKANH